MVKKYDRMRWIKRSVCAREVVSACRTVSEAAVSNRWGHSHRFSCQRKMNYKPQGSQGWQGDSKPIAEISLERWQRELEEVTKERRSWIGRKHLQVGILLNSAFERSRILPVVSPQDWESHVPKLSVLPGRHRHSGTSRSGYNEEDLWFQKSV